MTADVFRFLLTADIPEPADSLENWWTQYGVIAGQFDDSVDVAAATGFVSGSVAYAFGSGYQAALGRLVPELGADIAAFCATERGGGHPRAIETTLDGDRVTGTKTFVTMGSSAKDLLVVATEGTGDDGRPKLRLVRVHADQGGVVIVDRPPLPIVPELPHGEVRFDNASTVTVLAGDGYLEYVKPFRTIEDIHVSAALVGWLIRVSRESRWPQETCGALLASLAALRGLGQADASAPGVHIALAGVLSAMTRTLASLDPLWDSAEPEIAAMWARDKAILHVATRVRAARLEAAWGAVAHG